MPFGMYTTFTLHFKCNSFILFLFEKFAHTFHYGYILYVLQPLHTTQESDHMTSQLNFSKIT